MATYDCESTIKKEEKRGNKRAKKLARFHETAVQVQALVGLCYRVQKPFLVENGDDQIKKIESTHCAVQR